MNNRNHSRRYDLDWLRVLAILAIFVFHCTRPFDTDDWSIKNAATFPWMDIWKDFAMTWGMPLILLISGASAFLALDRFSPGKYLKGLFARLLLPLLVGMFTHVAFQVYLENLQKGAFSGTFWQFYPHYFDGMYGFGGNFAWMGLHLWYLELLFFISLFFLPLLVWLKRTAPGRRAVQGLTGFLSLPGAVYLLALPAILLMRTLDPATWGNQDLGGWSVLIYPLFFLSGFLIISSQRLQARIYLQRWLSLALALGLTPLYLFLEFQTSPTLRPLAHALADPLYCLVCWSWLLVVLGFSLGRLNFTNPFLKYTSEASLPFYILHQTAIVTLAYFITAWQIPALLKFLLILIGSFSLVAALYEFLVRRLNLLRFLFGIKPLPTPSTYPVEQVLASASGSPADVM